MTDQVYLNTHQSQLASAIESEDYEDAARIKVAIAAAATSDTVGRAMSYLKVEFSVLAHSLLQTCLNFIHLHCILSCL